MNQALSLLSLLLLTSQCAIALSLHDLDPAFERCEAIKLQHKPELPPSSDPFWLLGREEQMTVLVYLHERSMAHCTAEAVDMLALQAFHKAVAGEPTFLDTLIKARSTSLTQAQQAQLQQVGKVELARLEALKGFDLPFSLTDYLKLLAPKEE
ncbi:hypothetical protein OB952_09305 [Aeromonas salmonicida]|uniref:hypothetical protein n=1 Tax=Aeromonas salmonicida TaxID=645 RepID=UPI00259FD8E6|nr:hypothetical protein [Aeromonas salmonicida]MDM5067560.1 hypothetical protein [Aeromonas salmonicida]